MSWCLTGRASSGVWYIMETGEAVNEILLMIGTQKGRSFFMKVNEKVLQAAATTYEYLFRTPVPGGYLARSKDKTGIVTGGDKAIAPIGYDDIRPINERFFLTVEGGRQGFADAANQFFVQPAGYDYVECPVEWFKENNKTWYLFLVTKDSVSYYVDNFGKEYIAK